MKNIKRLMLVCMTIFIVFSIIGCMSTGKSDNYSTVNVPASQDPPGGLSPEEVPVFVVIGFDDNGYSGYEGSRSVGGFKFVIDLFNSRTNPEGNGNARTFDGAPCHFSYYVNGMYISDSDKAEDNAVYVKRAWKAALDTGHEIASHTYHHWHGGEFTVKDWIDDLKMNDAMIAKPFDPEESPDALDNKKGIGVDPSTVIGFRSPFLEYNNNTFIALSKMGFVYDCSLQEGFAESHDGTNFYWPYTLDTGSEGDRISAEWFDRTPIDNYPGLWEIPTYAVIVPPDEKCSEYGVEPGFRDRMYETRDYFDVNDGKITGFDWNLFIEFKMSKEEVLACLKYSLDLRLEGNRSPFTFGTHSDVYADKYGKTPRTTYIDRQEVMSEFIDYALTKPEVRIVSAKELLDWILDPVAL